MKYLIYISALCITLSCTDDLIESPKSLVVESFYNTKAEVETAIAAIYDPFRSGSVFGAIYLSQQECKSDQIRECRGSWVPVSEFEGLNNTNISRISGTWVQLYRSIRNANLVIGNVSNGKELTESEKAQYIAEAKFLRALAYFHLVRNWGGVPLRTEENSDEADLSRNSVDEVYDLIQEDLVSAEKSLPTSSISGRANIWAAKALLADVYLNLEKYSLAAEKANDIIKSGNFSLVPVEKPEDFELLYGSSVVGSPEVIFSFNFNETSGWSHVRYAHGVNVPYLGVSGYYVFYSDAQQPNYVNWDDNDLRKQYNWYSWDTPLGELLMNKKFSDPGQLVARNDYPLYKYSEILLLYSEAISRSKESPSEEAVNALNQVHRRAYGYNSENGSPVDFVVEDFNLEELINIIIKERGYETQGEGKRWLDLKRLGKAKEYIKETLNKEVSDKSLLWPIPDNEINFNKAISPSDQNPGY
ncbi:RagB/SusD family nutrient uptake outer membrane protein [Membranicola marinus]|uniref:RagB/SusD family nutrient uptake outer membrane protein n=1 Tax=Membranihabitans marinus TaxID=1227546 RepID=A0A953LC51_9BACT|nr:RagB/SusD family nutrient uptake outer membrane protein [Membranihabitans marinus]MBY5959171.1 RagB/SusD family nutrient uptake outer membrane protein [Membranihabitans marinus]